MPVSASREHSLANVRKTPEEMVEQVRAIAALRDELVDAAGDLDRVTSRVEHLLAHGTGADVQRGWREAGADDAGIVTRASERTLA